MFVFLRVRPSHLVNQSCLQSSHGQVAVFRGSEGPTSSTLTNLQDAEKKSAVTVEVFINLHVCFYIYQHKKCSTYLTITQFHCYSTIKVWDRCRCSTLTVILNWDDVFFFPISMDCLLKPNEWCFLTKMCITSDAKCHNQQSFGG